MINIPIIVDKNATAGRLEHFFNTGQGRFSKTYSRNLPGSTTSWPAAAYRVSPHGLYHLCSNGASVRPKELRGIIGAYEETQSLQWKRPPQHQNWHQNIFPTCK